MRNLWVLALTGLVLMGCQGMPNDQYPPSYYPPPTDNTAIPGWWAYQAGERYRLQGNCKESLAMYREALVQNPGLLEASEGLRRAQREICHSTSGGSKRPPTVERATDFTGGGRALKPGEW
jgi:hypothetical protein